MHRNSNITGNPISTFHNAGILNFWRLEYVDNQHCYSHKNTFTFTGKEKDAETGFSYFGARYYDSDLSGLFLSVDPMADKYPSISPYAYCAWNPVKLVDPDGREIDDYRLNICTGELRFYQFTNETRDCIISGYYDDNNEWVDIGNSFDCAKGLLIADMSIYNATRHIVTNEPDGLAFMTQVSFACHKELAAYAFLSGPNNSLEIFPWSNNDDLNCHFLEPEAASYNTILYDIHTHCGTDDYTNDTSGTLFASDTDKNNIALRNEWGHYIISIKHGLGKFNNKRNLQIDRDDLTNSLSHYFRYNPVE